MPLYLAICDGFGADAPCLLASGDPDLVKDVAELIARRLGCEVPPRIANLKPRRRNALAQGAEASS